MSCWIVPSFFGVTPASPVRAMPTSDGRDHRRLMQTWSTARRRRGPTHPPGSRTRRQSVVSTLTSASELVGGGWFDGIRGARDSDASGRRVLHVVDNRCASKLVGGRGFDGIRSARDSDTSRPSRRRQWWLSW